MKTTGIHHVTAIASDPQRNLDFYTQVLGLRFVKRTVNFDDPASYHFYFADECGSPGTILTFFPWPGAKRGRQGAGSVTATAFRVPAGSLAAWADRLRHHGVRVLSAPAAGSPAESRFGAPILRFEDHDGMPLELIESPDAANSRAWHGADVPAAIAIRGFHSVTLTVNELAPTADLLTSVLGYRRADSAGARTRFTTDAAAPGVVIDVLEDPAAPESVLGAGVVHHVAIRARDEADQREWLEALRRARFAATDVRDRTYFRSIYFRERGGVLFEIATDNPGFTADEPLDSLGHALKLPPGLERHRAKIEQHLPPITLRSAPAADTAPPSDLAAYTHRFIPASAPGAPRTLVLLHGTGGSEDDLLPLGKRVAPGAALLSPRGDVNENGQLRFFKRLREGVFDQDDLRIRTRALSRWIAAAIDAYRIDPALATMVGFSNGANIAAAMLLAGVAPIGRAILIRAMVPFTPDPLPDLSAVNVLMLSGRDDPIVPSANSERLADLLRRAGATVDHQVLDAAHNLTARDLTLAAQWL